MVLKIVKDLILKQVFTRAAKKKTNNLTTATKVG